jgi:hypothetical protein
MPAASNATPITALNVKTLFGTSTPYNASIVSISIGSRRFGYGSRGDAELRLNNS